MSWQEKKVLITGINGFLGSNISSSLADQGAQIYGFGRKKPLFKKKDHNNTFPQYFAGNIDNQDSIADAIESCEPDIIFHLAAQSSVANSFEDPAKTCLTNCLGTSNLLEAVTRLEVDPVIVFAGSSDEYGLVFSTIDQYNTHIEEYGEIDQPPVKIPEIPITEDNPFRPQSPYAISKIYGDLLMRNYQKTYGIKTVVCRSFNVEGAGRGDQYVTSVITQQVAELQKGNTNTISIGNINPVRDFSHVNDVVKGYQILAEKGSPGNAYNLGSMRGVSIASYLFTCLETAGYPIDAIITEKSKRVVSDPLSTETTQLFGIPLPVSKIDKGIIHGEISFSLADGGIIALSGNKKIKIKFNTEKFRPADIPILIADASKISKIGYHPSYSLLDIIRDQLRFYQDGATN